MLIIIERLQLLIHIMRKPAKPNITADSLREVAQDSKRSLRDDKKLEEMEEILKVRKLEERYERGEVGMYFFLGSTGKQITDLPRRKHHHLRQEP